MPCSEDGVPAEIILNTLSLVGRLNPSVLYEQELNFIASEVIKKYKEDGEILGNREDLKRQPFIL